MYIFYIANVGKYCLPVWVPPVREEDKISKKESGAGIRTRDLIAGHAHLYHYTEHIAIYNNLDLVDSETIVLQVHLTRWRCVSDFSLLSVGCSQGCVDEERKFFTC